MLAVAKGGGGSGMSESVTEAEWLTTTALGPMLAFLTDKATNRKLRLFFCACGRLAWPLLTQSEYQEAIEIGERFADGQATSEQLQEADNRVSGAYWSAVWPGQGRPPPLAEQVINAQRHITLWAAHPNEKLHRWSRMTSRCLVQTYAPDVEPAQCVILRDIFGNPFHSVSFNPAWRTPTVQALATAAYEERILPAGHLEPDRLAILADALEDAGCTDAQILSHLRGPSGPHVRGCWVIDLLLGKE
jgi:hypothetical protein